MKRQAVDGAITERAAVSDEEREAALEALWRRLNDPDGFDWEVLKNIEELTERTHPVDGGG
jgi:hypothetical protein